MDEIKLIPCGNCAWCIKCTQGIDISKVFAIWNSYARTGDRESFLRRYDELEVKPDRCIRCRQCKLLCARNIDIVQKLAEVATNALKR